MNKHKIRVVRGPSMQDQSITTVVGAITVGTLAAKGTIPYYDAAQKTAGYQRLPKPQRINEIINGIKDKRVDLPTAILLNARENQDKVLSGGDDNLIFDVEHIKHLYIVDGQHRHLALKELLKTGDIPESYKIPFVSMIGASPEVEMEQFYVVNSTSKSVQTDLALSILRGLAQSEGGGKIMKALVGKGLDWKILAQELVEEVSENSPMWRGRVRLANQSKGNTVIPATSMATSFEIIIKRSSFFTDIGRDRQIKILSAYWDGIQKIIPEAFSKPGQYSIQKGVGVRAMHGVLPNVLERVRSGRRSWFSADAYAEVLQKPLEELSGDNGHGDSVRGFAFWLTGKDGAAATYSSGVGIRTLIDKIKKLLPPIEISDPE